MIPLWDRRFEINTVYEYNICDAQKNRGKARLTILYFLSNTNQHKILEQMHLTNPSRFSLFSFSNNLFYVLKTMV